MMTKKNGDRSEYWVDQTHAGYNSVVLKVKEDGMGVWVESDGKVGASLDLSAGVFRSEHEKQFSWAVYGKGAKIAEGSTGTILSLLVPW